MDRILARFGESSELKLNGVPMSQVLRRPELAYLKKLETLSAETKRKIIERHVVRYQRQLSAGLAGGHGIRVDETETYLRTWQAGDVAHELGQPLPLDCCEEMLDAVESGDVDDLLTDEERKQWQP